MARPTRVDALGEIFMVTTATWRRRPLLTQPRIAELVTETLFAHRDAGEFDLLAWVLMPDHAHFVLQPKDRTLAEVMRRFKSLSWRRCRLQIGLMERLWQEGFHDRGVRSELALNLMIDYVHLNPVQAGLVRDPDDWSWSSFRIMAGDEPRPTGP